MPKADRLQKLVGAFLELRTSDECGKFLADLLTRQELKNAANRFAMASELFAGATQREVSGKFGVSPTTVSRVNAALVAGAGGYETVLRKLRRE